MSKFTEQELIKGCMMCNRLHQEELYKKNYSLFLKICVRYTKDIHDAEQLMNDSFLKIFNNIKKFENKGSFEGWMKRIVVNNCLDYLKSKITQEQKKTMYSELMQDNHTLISQNDAIGNIGLQELVSIIQTLPTMSKTVFNLFVFEGYNHKEIGQELNISEGTSQWHVNNARKILKNKITKELNKSNQ